jgi:glycosyl transferase family 9 (putative heptosyltransferase)
VSVVAVRGALAIHPGALGDVLLAIPALRALRATASAVTLAAQRHLAALLSALGEADAGRDFETLRLEALFTGAGEAALPPAERVVCWFGARDTDFTRRLRAQTPGAIVAPSTGTGLVWEHLLRTAGLFDGDWRAAACVDAALVAAGRAALVEAGWDGTRRLIVVQAGAGSVRKCWPTDGFVATLGDLLRSRELTLVLHEGPADAAAVDALASRLPGALRLRGPALPALAGVLRLASVYLGNDSGVSHLAATVGAPAVVLFAAANLAWRPWALQPEVLTVSLVRVESTDVASVRTAIQRRLG